MKRIIVIVVLLIVVSAGAVWIAVEHAPRSRRIIKEEKIPHSGGIEQPALHTERKVVPAVMVSTPTPAPEAIAEAPRGPLQIISGERKLAPMRIYTAANIEAAPTPEEDRGNYAPIFRYVRCKLVNTVDSSSGARTPVDGMVTDDLVWDGKMIIRKCSEVHGWAQVDKERERILAEGAWTFVLAESNGQLGNRELVLKGAAMDRQDDPEFAQLMVAGNKVDTLKGTWGITDGSAGLRGVVIKTNNGDILNAFVAAFIGGIAGTVTQFSTVIAPEQGGTNVSVPSYVAAPAAQGISSVMLQYAEQIMRSIEKDGFFIRVPAGKLFYVRVDESILTGRATVGGSKRLKSVQSDFLEDREQLEKVTQSRSQREDKKDRGFQMNPEMLRQMEQAAPTPYER